MTTAIQIDQLRKSFGDKTVLDGIDLSVDAGTVFALLGPNGAGKTTLVHICSTLLRPDAGTVRVAGYDVVTQADSVRDSIGLTGQFAAVDSLLTGRENLQLMADLRHLPKKLGRARVEELLERFDLADAASKPLASYSGGMRRRLDLAMTLVGGGASGENPSGTSIIFLDEPTTGLDPRSRATMWEIVRSLVDDGMTIFLTTQYLEEADQLADRIAVLNDGRVAAQGSPADLKRLVPGGHVRLRFSDSDARDSARRQLAGLGPRPGEIGHDDSDALTLTIDSDGSFASVKAIVDRLDATARVDDLSIGTPNLDDVFFALTGSTSTATQEVSR
ncbi:putative ABC transporter ATP-binding protein [Gordonia effusa NBRC 100432]|uniref:Putative ABC transporter ATP-binding protein n=1 Tax=Gordonia effusa NBRC 100432 TaxID=1077974 RepID=H0R3L1_9ACTN|nr:daunorubicin resistance protein DrrA family ABC transporter ATP-binding protein [Gordonia effusa]GAB19662.1 putative ABC transporter ATP-binding protein [Gordonia effusa NBRC 100432]